MQYNQVFLCVFFPVLQTKYDLTIFRGTLFILLYVAHDFNLLKSRL
jgi:hypothetical protein